jgi:hypothetical protein
MFPTKLKIATLVVLGVGSGLAFISTQAITAKAEAVKQVVKPAVSRDRAESVPAPTPKSNTIPGQIEPNKVRDLQRERLALLRELATAMNKKYEQGTVPYGAVQEVSRQVLKAELDLCGTETERIALLQKTVDALKDREKRVAQIYKQGGASEFVVTETKLDRLDSEITLEKAKAAGSNYSPDPYRRQKP